MHDPAGTARVVYHPARDAPPGRSRTGAGPGDSMERTALATPAAARPAALLALALTASALHGCASRPPVPSQQGQACVTTGDCAPGLECSIVEGGYGACQPARTGPIAPGGRGLGQTCERNDDCAPGLKCRYAENGPRCGP